MIYLAIDGDDVGREVERLVLSGALDELERFSAALEARISQLSSALCELGGEVKLKGGDSVLAVFSSHVAHAELFTALSPLLAPREGVTFSVGLGESPRGAWLALKVAKTFKPAAFVQHDQSLDSIHRVDSWALSSSEGGSR